MKDYLKTCCPICGRNMYVYQYGYRCERCGFTIQAFICNRHINRDEAESIILHDTNILDGFSKNDGKVFSSIPVIKGSTVTLDNTICHCWYGGGRLYVDTKWFNLSNSQSRQQVLSSIMNLWNKINTSRPTF